jgi:hypothetical protein
MGCEPKFGQNFLVCTDAGRYILALDPSQDRVFRDLKDAGAILGKDHDVIAGLWQELATPALPTDGLVPGVGWRTRQTIRRRQGEHQQGQHHVDAHGPRGFCGGCVTRPCG